MSEASDTKNKNKTNEVGGLQKVNLDSPEKKKKQKKKKTQNTKTEYLKKGGGEVIVRLQQKL